MEAKKIKLTELGKCIDALKNCEKSGNKIWFEKWTEKIEELSELLPHGSGIDGKCEINLEHSTGEKIVLFVEFHHLNNGGYYDGWTMHNITFKPSFVHGCSMDISGRNKDGIKEYLRDLFGGIFEL